MKISVEISALMALIAPARSLSCDSRLKCRLQEPLKHLPHACTLLVGVAFGVDHHMGLDPYTDVSGEHGVGCIEEAIRHLLRDFDARGKAVPRELSSNP